MDDFGGGPVGQEGFFGSLRVVEVTDLRGALCGRILADLGATVTRIDDGRPPAPHEAVAHAYRHAGKRTARPDRLDSLLAEADVLIDNDPPDRSAGADLDPGAVRRRHPRLVHVAIRDFGLDGPRAGWRLEPLTAQAAGGTLFASGLPGLPPCWFPGFLGPDCASVYGALGAVAAVMDRARHGQGQTVEVSVQEATLAGTAPWSVAVNDYLKIIPVLPARGTRNGDGIYWVLPCADGWVRTIIGNEKQWQGFLQLLGRPDVISSDEWRDPMFRRMNGDVVRMVASDCLLDRTRAQLFEQARHVGATLGVIHRPSEFVAHEQVRARQVFTDARPVGFEGAPLVRPPLQISAPVPAPAPPPPPRPDDGLLLEGVRVVEFGMAAVGPEVSLVLSELGADVIKVESATHLDVLRQTGFDRVNCGFAFNAECRGRRSVTLNLDTAEGRRLAFDLCARADVVVENFRGGVLDRLGLGYEAVKGSNPGVVYVSSQGYGRSGPLAEMPAYGPLNLGFVGLHLLWNHPDAPYPAGSSLNHPDHVAGKFIAIGVLAALEERWRTGAGRRVDLAQIDLAAYLRGEVYLEAHLDGADPEPAGNASPGACPHGVYRAQGDDEWIAVAVMDDSDWQSLCQALGWPDGGTDLGARLAKREDIDARLAEWTAARPAVEAAELLQAHGVSAVPVMGPLDHLADEHLTARRFVVELHHPEVGSERHVGNPIRFSLTGQRVAGSAPCLGAHTEEVLREVLGLDPAEVAALAGAGVLT